MAYSKRLLSAGEEIVREFRPHWRLLFLPIFYGIIGVVLAVLVHTIIPPKHAAWDWIATAVIVVLLVPLAAGPFGR